VLKTLKRTIKLIIPKKIIRKRKEILAQRIITKKLKELRKRKGKINIAFL